MCACISHVFGSPTDWLVLDYMTATSGSPKFMSWMSYELDNFMLVRMKFWTMDIHEPSWDLLFRC